MKYNFSYRPFAQSLYPALVEDAFYIAMEASVDENALLAKEAMIRYMDYSMKEAKTYGRLYLPDQGEYGAAIWSMLLDEKTDAIKTEEKKSFLYQFMGPKSLETYQAIVAFMSEKTAAVVEDNYWYLSIVGIHPDLQGQGLGPPLIEKGLSTTDQLRVPTFLETFTRRNMSFYKRLGYKAVASFFEPTAKAEYWVMTRNPA